MTRATPYWWDDVCYPSTGTALPSRCDLLVVGAGYTGLTAATEAARAGLSVTVVEKGEIGAGCSSRNGGQIAHGLKPSVDKLARRLGRDLAEAYHREDEAAVGFVEGLIGELGLGLSWQRNGVYCAAHSQKKFDILKRQVDAAGQGGAYIVEPADRWRELGSDHYVGGVVSPSDSSVQPAKLHQALVTRALAAGVTIICQCDAMGVDRTADGFDVQTGLGRVQSKKLLIATNGYTGALLKWARRRIIPIGTYMLATEALSDETCGRTDPKPAQRGRYQARRGLFPHEPGRQAADFRRARGAGGGRTRPNAGLSW